MKAKLFAVFFSLILSAFIIPRLNAQEKLPDTELLMVHEDVVYPYMIDKYEKAAKDYVEMLKAANIEQPFRVLQFEYFTFNTIRPLKDYDGLAKQMGMRDGMIEKIGKEKFEKVMAEFDGCYSSHKNYLLTLRNDLSYKPKYGMDPEEGINYRHIDFFYIIPGKEAEMTQLIKEYKVLYESKNIEEGYRVYYGGIGTDMPMVMFVQPAKSRVDFATLSDKQDEILGDDGTKFFNQVLSITQKFEHNDGVMRPDLFYMPK
jgi:hypothetical protein